MKSESKHDSKQAVLGNVFQKWKGDRPKFTEFANEKHTTSSQQTDLFESVGAFVLKPMRKVIRGNKMRTLASKSIRIQKTLGKIVIDNNQKVTWSFFITNFQNYIRVNFANL